MSEQNRNIVEEEEVRWIAEQQRAGSTEGVPDHADDQGGATSDSVDPGTGVSGPAATAAGAVAGGVAGTLFFGPVGAIVGAVTGAVAGSAARDERPSPTPVLDESVERIYRADYDRSPYRLDDRPFEVARPAYLFGYLAGRHPELRGQSFEQMESVLRERWGAELGGRHGAWDNVRTFVRTAYHLSAARAAGETFADADGADSKGRASYADPMPPPA